MHRVAGEFFKTHYGWQLRNGTAVVSEPKSNGQLRPRRVTAQSARHADGLVCSTAYPRLDHSTTPRTQACLLLASCVECLLKRLQLLSKLPSFFFDDGAETRITSQMCRTTCCPFRSVIMRLPL